jgi:hypothetical protein
VVLLAENADHYSLSCERADVGKRTCGREEGDRRLCSVVVADSLPPCSSYEVAGSTCFFAFFIASPLYSCGLLCANTHS